MRNVAGIDYAETLLRLRVAEEWEVRSKRRSLDE